MRGSPHTLGQIPEPCPSPHCTLQHDDIPPRVGFLQPSLAWCPHPSSSPLLPSLLPPPRATNPPTWQEETSQQQRHHSWPPHTPHPGCPQGAHLGLCGLLTEGSWWTPGLYGRAGHSLGRSHCKEERRRTGARGQLVWPGGMAVISQCICLLGSNAGSVAMRPDWPAHGSSLPNLEPGTLP